LIRVRSKITAKSFPGKAIFLARFTTVAIGTLSNTTAQSFQTTFLITINDEIYSTRQHSN
jgi:hypothetical protein